MKHRTLQAHLRMLENNLLKATEQLQAAREQHRQIMIYLHQENILTDLSVRSPACLP